MKKKFFYSALFLMGMAFTGFTAASCSDDNDNTGNGPGTNPGTEGNGGLDAATMRKPLPVGATIRSK